MARLPTNTKSMRAKAYTTSIPAKSLELFGGGDFQQIVNTVLSRLSKRCETIKAGMTCQAFTQPWPFMPSSISTGRQDRTGRLICCST